jgi:hypothetical protein
MAVIDLFNNRFFCKCRMVFNEFHTCKTPEHCTLRSYQFVKITMQQ